MELNHESLLAVQIKDEELSELLQRLAATEAMFQEPVSTIRDVVELTDATPTLVARILDEMRGNTDLQILTERVNAHDKRFEAVERQLRQIPKVQPAPVIQVAYRPQQTDLYEEKTPEQKFAAGLIVFFVIVLLSILIFGAKNASSNSSRSVRESFTSQ